MHPVKLEVHPDSRNTPVRGIGVSLYRERDGLSIGYTIEADVDRLRVPPERRPRIGRDLWKHTCCECFVALKADPEYHELNFSPSHEWAAYAFSNYREGAPLTDETLDPRIAVRRFADRLEIDATIALERLSQRYRDTPLMIGLSAVIEDADGRLSYWALAHPATKPDFHRREAFVLEVPAV